MSRCLSPESVCRCSSLEPGLDCFTRLVWSGKKKWVARVARGADSFKFASGVPRSARLICHCVSPMRATASRGRALASTPNRVPRRQSVSNGLVRGHAVRRPRFEKICDERVDRPRASSPLRPVLSSPRDNATHAPLRPSSSGGARRKISNAVRALASRLSNSELLQQRRKGRWDSPVRFSLPEQWGARCARH